MPGCRIPAGATLVWLASARFRWRFPEQVGLFLSLLALAKAGCTTKLAGSAIAVITAETACAAYETYAAVDIAPRNTDEDSAASGGHATTLVDPNLYEPSEPAFTTINKIEPAQKAFFERTVASMKEKPYEEWTDLWVRPPNPTMVDFDVSTSAAWTLLPICFYSPTRPLAWRRLGVQMPCARHGWAHARFVTVTNQWAQRLVKGVFTDFTLAGQKTVCSECRKEHGRLKMRLRAATSSGLPQAELDVLTAELKAASYGFMTYDARVVRAYFERAPWLALQLPALVTHKAALSIEALQLLVSGVRRGATNHGTEAMLTEFRALGASTALVAFYSFQRSWARRSQLAGPSTALPVVHLNQGISSISDTYLGAVLDDWYFHGTERYLLLWFEQHCHLDIVQTDHHCKYSSRLMHDGERALPNVYKAMNSWGGLPISVFTETTSYSDATLVRAHDNLRAAAERHGIEPPTYAVLDNPHKDAPGLRANIWAGGGKPRFTFPGEIVVVTTEAECNRACAELTSYNLFSGDVTTVYWDTETVAYLDGSGTNTNKAALVQICRGAAKCFLFRVALWPSCFPSFQALMANVGSSSGASPSPAASSSDAPDSELAPSSSTPSLRRARRALCRLETAGARCRVFSSLSGSGAGAAAGRATAGLMSCACSRCWRAASSRHATAHASLAP